MLSDVGDDNAVFSYLVAYSLNYLVRSQHALFVLWLIIKFSPLVYLSKPLVVFCLFDKRQQLVKHLFDVTDNAEVAGYILVDLRGVYVDMNYLCLADKFVFLRSHSVGKSCADCDYQIAACNSSSCRHTAVHTYEPEIKFLAPAQHSRRPKRVSCRYLSLLQKL